mmetsp:Transcript_140048/g.390352  ORF Transcript_140048/g.390352 Transcript_140048/m.390352 type:complete len:355 (+) Transcript_140048:189-1253(+)
MPVLYDPEAGHLHTVFKLTHSIVPSVVQRWEFWMFLTFELVLSIAFRAGYLEVDEGRSEMNKDDMKVVAAITTFVEVFYTNQCYSRYLRLYRTTRLAVGVIYDYCFTLRLHIATQCPQHARLANRQLIASVLLFFYEMNSQVSETEWNELLQQGLVKPEEQKFLASFSQRQHSLIMLQWSAEAALRGCSEVKTPANVLNSLVDKLLKCRELQQVVFDTAALQMPFQYFHILRVMVVVNSACWAWFIARSGSLFGPFLYVVILFVLMGMIELASQLADPFGDDDVDFPLTEWLNECVENAEVLMEFQSPDAFLEEALATEIPLNSGIELSLDLGSSRASRDAEEYEEEEALVSSG